MASGRTPQLQWWHENAPWLPNIEDRPQKNKYQDSAAMGADKSLRPGFEIPVHEMAKNKDTFEEFTID